MKVQWAKSYVVPEDVETKRQGEDPLEGAVPQHPGVGQGAQNNDHVLRRAWSGGDGKKCLGSIDVDEIKSTRRADELEMRDEIIGDVKDRICTTV